MLVTNNNAKAIEVLKRNSYAALSELEVILIELDNKPGALETITAKIATEGVDVRYIYGTACSGGCPAKIILSTTDNKKALALLKS